MLRLNLFTYRDLRNWLDTHSRPRHSCRNPNNLHWRWRDLDRHTQEKIADRNSEIPILSSQALRYQRPPSPPCPVLGGSVWG
jgi:hypothetical protein